jgi:cell division protease FtsH
MPSFLYIIKLISYKYKIIYKNKGDIYFMSKEKMFTGINAGEQQDGSDIEYLPGFDEGFDGFLVEEKEEDSNSEEQPVKDDSPIGSDAKKIFVGFVKDRLKEIFNDNSSITEIQENLYSINIEKVQLEFKTTTIGLTDIATILSLINDVHNFKTKEKELTLINYLVEGIEQLHSATISKQETTESLSLVLLMSEPLINGGFRISRKVVLCINNIPNINYNYAIKNNLVSLSMDEIQEKNNRILCKTFGARIEKSALAYAMILEDLDKHNDETGVYVEFNFYFHGISVHHEIFRNFEELFGYISFYDARIRGSITADYFGGSTHEEERLIKNNNKVKEEVFKEDPINFSSIYGLDSIKEELRIIAESLKYKFNNKGTKLSIPKGILLIGAPGTGKSFIIKAFAKEFDIQMVSLNNFATMTGHNSTGITADTIRKCFSHMRQISKHKPSFVFIDEMDKIITRNNEDAMAVLLENLSSDADFLVIGAGNSDNNFPPALTRPGRFDKKMYFGELSFIAKISIFKKILDKKEIDYKHIDIPAVIDYLPKDTTVATLDAIAKQALIIKIILKEEVDTVKMIGICESILEGTSEIVKTDKTSLERTAWHEAGHAVMGLLLNKKITVATIKRSYRALGYVMFRYNEEEVPVYEDYVKAIRTSIGGWAAEKLIYNDLSVGATFDFMNVQELINFLTTFTGDSGVNLISTNSSLNINQSVEERKDIYNVKKSKMKKFINYTTKTLKKHRLLLDQVYNLLISKEKVSGTELETIYDNYKKKNNNKGIRKLLFGTK